MIRYQREQLHAFVQDAQALLALHYGELTLNKEHVRLDPIWRRYEALEKQGSFVLMTVRDDERLVGYSAFFVQTHIHYADLLVAHNDVLFLHPDYRKGMCGIKLIRESEALLKRIGVDKVTWHIKPACDFTPILLRMGYVSEEVMMGKLLQRGD